MVFGIMQPVVPHNGANNTISIIGLSIPLVLFFGKKFMLKLADRLRGMRGTESQTAFAARFGLKQAIYSHYETGRKKPSLEVLMQMATVLHTTTDYLLGLSDEPPAPSAPGTAVTTGANSPIISGNGNSVTIGAPGSPGTARPTRKRK